MPHILDDLPPGFLRTFAVLFGLVWGSFLNVVIYRVPRNLNIAFPASHCTTCDQPIKGWDNIPILSFILLRGRSRCCHERIAWRYPLVEAIGAVLSVAILEMLVLHLPPDTPLVRAGAIYLADFALALALVAAALIDLEHMYLPDAITFGGTVLGIATASFRNQTLLSAAMGAVVGFVVVWLPFIVIYSRLRGMVGMGFGDAKLLMLAGAWFGWPGTIFVLALGAVQGTVAVVGTLVVRGRIEEPAMVKEERERIRREIETLPPTEREVAEREFADDPLAKAPGPGFGQQRIPLGPFLSLAILECLFFGQSLFTWAYLG